MVLKGLKISDIKALHLYTGPIGRSTTSLNNYQYILRNIPEEQEDWCNAQTAGFQLAKFLSVDYISDWFSGYCLLGFDPWQGGISL